MTTSRLPARHLLVALAAATLATFALAHVAHADPIQCAATGDVEQADIFSRALAKGGALFAFGAAYLAGLAACATPCVYPMIGITVSVFGAKQAKSRKESMLLSGLFVLGIAALYTPLGLFVALSHSVWGRALSSPYVSLGLSALFVAMAASMFGAFEIALPASIQNRLASVGGVGPKGAFLIGLVSGLIASPCVTAPFGAIIGSFGKAGVGVGTASVFLFSIGLGTPFFFVGAFSARLPKPGAWMNYVKSFFGVVLVVIALFYAKNAIPLLQQVGQRGTTFLVIAIAATVIGLGLGAVHLSFGDGSTVMQKVRKGLGVTLAVAGGFALISWVGPDLPPQKPVDWMADADGASAMAKSQGKPMIVDFTAKWCTACHEMEKTTFVDPRFTKSAERFIAVRIDGSDQDSPIFSSYSERFEVVGLPAVVILDSHGNVAKIFRERVEADQLIAILDKVC